MEENQFDVVILGTGLVESIVSAALAKAGYKVAHIDSNSYYGGDEASLSLEELVEWAGQVDQLPNPTSRYQRRSHCSEVPSQSRQYSICLQPTVLPAVGSLVSSLVMSGVAKYSGFRLLDCVSVYDSTGRARSVPGSKEDIFKSKDISLIEKRRLMRFLTFAAGDFDGKKELEGKHEMPFLEFLQSVFSLSEETSSVIAYSLAFCMSPTEPTLLCLQRLQKYLRSSGRYGPSPFLIGHYGGIGDIAQGFCRAAAVSGGVYILSRKVLSVSPIPPSNAVQPTNTTRIFNYAVTLQDFPDTLSCNLVISPSSYVPHNLNTEVRRLPSPNARLSSQIKCIARCIAIIDQALSIRSPAVSAESGSSDSAEQSAEEEVTQTPPPAMTDATPVDTGIVIFPPSSVTGGSTTHSATVLINGEGSMSTPKGKWIIYIGLPLDSIPEASLSPESCIRPYLDALMTLSFSPSQSPIKPLFTTYFMEIPGSVAPEVQPDQSPQSTYLVPPSIPIASIPDIPDEATAIAENTYREAIKVLHVINNDAVVKDEDIAFWPPLPVEDEEDDNEW